MTDAAKANPTTSSARIILGEVRRHRLGVSLALAFALAVVAVSGVMVYRALNRRAANARGAPLSPAPFSSLPGSEDHAAFSPDGNQLAFIWDGGAGGQFDIYVKLIGVGTPLRLTTHPAEEYHPAWSPDGRHIAFLRLGQTQDEVIIVPALGGSERQLCSVSTTARNRIAWSPDGRWLALGDNPDGRNQGLVLIAVETGAKQVLTRPPPTFGDDQPAFSPDGRQLVFVRTNSPTACELYLIAVDGSGEQQLTTGSRHINGADWTADGREIVYSATRAGKATLWRVPVSGGEPTALPGVGWNVYQPVVARRGGLLAFTENYDDTSVQRLELPSLNQRARAPEGDRPTTLINTKSGEDSPQISPDGTKIAFASDRSGSQEIWVCDRDGGNLLQVTQIEIGQSVEVSALLRTRARSASGVSVVFYDGDPAEGGQAFDVERIPHLRARDTYEVRVLFRPKGCGARRVFVSVGKGKPFEATDASLPVRVRCADGPPFVFDRTTLQGRTAGNPGN